MPVPVSPRLKRNPGKTKTKRGKWGLVYAKTQLGQNQNGEELKGGGGWVA